MKMILTKYAALIVSAIAIAAGSGGCQSVGISESGSFRGTEENRTLAYQTFNATKTSASPPATAEKTTKLAKNAKYSSQLQTIDPVIDLVPLHTGQTQSTKNFYTVQKGDTLSGIARKIYGDDALWRTIQTANTHLLQSPEDLQPGMKLMLP